MGSSRQRKNVKLRRRVKSDPCVVCGSEPCDPCHIRSFKVSQCDADWNLISMCRAHHIQQHAYGWGRMIERHRALAAILAEKGWEFFLTSAGNWKMFNVKEKELNAARRGNVSA